MHSAEPISDTTEEPTARAGDSIALYGSLMMGLPGTRRIQVAERIRFIGPCRLRGELYDLGDYPGLREGPGEVRAELYTLLDDGLIALLDRFEDFDPSRPHASIYLRKRIQLVEPSNVPAWAYFFNRPIRSEQRVPSGDWRAHVEQRVAARDPSRDRAASSDP